MAKPFRFAEVEEIVVEVYFLGAKEIAEECVSHLRAMCEPAEYWASCDDVLYSNNTWGMDLPF